MERRRKVATPSGEISTAGGWSVTEATGGRVSSKATPSAASWYVQPWGVQEPSGTAHAAPRAPAHGPAVHGSSAQPPSSADVSWGTPGTRAVAVACSRQVPLAPGVQVGAQSTAQASIALAPVSGLASGAWAGQVAARPPGPASVTVPAPVIRTETWEAARAGPAATRRAATTSTSATGLTAGESRPPPAATQGWTTD